jgi:hypothetical protein
MSAMYLVEEGNPAALSLAKKFLEYTPKVGGVIVLTEEERKAHLDGKLHRLEQPSNSVVDIQELDPLKNYIAVVKQGQVNIDDILRVPFKNIHVVRVK